MNIQEFLTRDGWPHHLREKDPVTIHDLMQLRRQTFYDLCETETNNGGLDARIPIDTKPGQEQVRILFARTIEEMVEAYTSVDPDHKREEWIDAINFASGILLLPTQRPPALEQIFLARFLERYPNPHEEFTNGITGSERDQLASLVIEWGTAMEVLRNRTWQKSIQQPYFQGAVTFADVVLFTWHTAFAFFEDWNHFCHFFIAKDQVLRFRLATRY